MADIVYSNVQSKLFKHLPHVSFVIFHLQSLAYPIIKAIKNDPMDRSESLSCYWNMVGNEKTSSENPKKSLFNHLLQCYGHRHSRVVRGFDERRVGESALGEGGGVGRGRNF